MFDNNCIYPFRLEEDPGFLYVMIDANLVSEAAQGLTTAQKATLNGYRWTPTADQLASGQIPVWAGNDPAPVYFRATDSQIKSALADWYTAPQPGETESFDTVRTTAAAAGS